MAMIDMAEAWYFCYGEYASSLTTVTENLRRGALSRD